jgi:hypothetical protein
MVPPQFIELRAPASPSAPVQATVDLDIGPDDSLGLSNPRSVLALATGFLVVDPGGRSPLTFFGARGAVENRVGSFGAGPGEFSKELSQAADLGDQILVPDFGNRRAVILDAASKAWVTSIPFPSTLTMPMSWVSVPPRRVAHFFVEADPWEKPRPEVVLLDRRSFEKVESITPAPTEMPSGVYPVAQALLTGPSAGTFAIATPGHGLIEVFDENGDPVRAFHILAEDPRAIGAGDRATLARAAGELEQRRLDRRIQMLRDRVPPEARHRVEGMKAARPSVQPQVEAEYPSFLHARFDPWTGWLWIARPVRGEDLRAAPYEVPWEDLRFAASRWEAYSPDGACQRRVAVPFGTIVTDVRDNRLFGIRIDSTGARRVVVLRAVVEAKGSE